MSIANMPKGLKRTFAAATLAVAGLMPFGQAQAEDATPQLDAREIIENYKPTSLYAFKQSNYDPMTIVNATTWLRFKAIKEGNDLMNQCIKAMALNNPSFPKLGKTPNEDLFAVVYSYAKSDKVSDDTKKRTSVAGLSDLYANKVCPEKLAPKTD